MKYKIVWDIVAEGLESLVNDEIKQGWKPFGGLCYDSQSDIYLQALIKVKE